LDIWGEAAWSRLVVTGLRAKTTTNPAESRINFEAPAILRKWPSLLGESRTEGTLPYFLVEGTLDERVRILMAKPASARHLIETRVRGLIADLAPVVEEAVPLNLNQFGASIVYE